MRTHVALLRGVNVGGRNRLAMADLRDIVTALGHADVSTYIQSGNAVFTSKEKDSVAIAEALERAIAAECDVKPRVVVLTRGELDAVVAGNPFPKENDGKRLHAEFGMDEFGPDGIKAVAAAGLRARAKGSPDEAVVVGRTLYLHTPDGLGRSVLAAELSRAGAGDARSARTMRNWATVKKLLDLLA